MNGQLLEGLASLAVLLGVALSWFARFRFIANDPGESPFAGRRWRSFPPRSLYRPPGFAIELAGGILAVAGVLLLLVRLLR